MSSRRAREGRQRDRVVGELAEAARLGSGVREIAITRARSAARAPSPSRWKRPSAIALRERLAQVAAELLARDRRTQRAAAPRA